jgi:rhodanese-related sulfurtransferase
MLKQGKENLKMIEEIYELDGEESKSTSDSKLEKGMIIIDLRTKEDYEIFHIADSINIPFTEIADKSRILKFKNKKRMFVLLLSNPL